MCVCVYYLCVCLFAVRVELRLCRDRVNVRVKGALQLLMHRYG